MPATMFSMRSSPESRSLNARASKTAHDDLGGLQIGSVHPELMDGEESEDEAAFIERARREYELRRLRNKHHRA